MCDEVLLLDGAVSVSVTSQILATLREPQEKLVI
jgi:hypothetical protein